MTNLVSSFVSAAFRTGVRLPLIVLREAQKQVASLLDQSRVQESATEERELSESQVERAQEALRAGIRNQTRASIETVKVGEEIRDKAVTADEVSI